MVVPPAGFFDPATLEDPLPFYAWLRREAPVWQVPETGHWVVSRHADVRRACLETETFSSKLAAVVTRDATGAIRLLDTGVAKTPKGRVLGVADGAPHARHRHALVRAFSPRRLRELEDRVRAIARESVDACLRRRELDLVPELAQPVPRRLMLAMLGLPRADEDRLQAWSDATISLMGGLPPREELERNAAAVADFEAYVSLRFDEAARVPREGLIGELALRVADGTLSRDEALGLVGQLVVGGMETTVGLIAAAARFLAELPGLWERLRESPDEIPAFVEEAVRLATPAQGNYRCAAREVTLGGVELPEGAILALLWLSANRDEREFQDPDRFALHRPNIKAQLGFGHGAHFCIGAAVARMETRIAVEELVARASRLAIAPGAELRHVPSVFIRRLASLPVELA